MKNKDWISLIETGYNLDGSDELWLENVLDSAVPLFDRGFWPSIMAYRFSPTIIDIDYVVTKGPSEMMRGACYWTKKQSNGKINIENC